MDPVEVSIQSFVVKVWLEPEADKPSWRGHVTHVPSGERRYVTTLSGVTAFIAPYLLQMGLDRAGTE